jgi:hypothetical protein
MKYIITSLLLIAVSNAALATDYYLSPSGSDNNAGTSTSKPWKTLSRANQAAFKPGDSLNLQGGANFSGGLSFGSDDAGDAAHPLVVGSYGNGRATITQKSGTGITIYNTGGITLQNLIVAGPGQTNSKGRYGIFVWSDASNGAQYDGVLMRNLEVKAFASGGVMVYSGHVSDPGFINLQLLSSEIHGNGLNGVQTAGIFQTGGSAHYPHKNLTIRDVRAYDNSGLPGQSSHSGSGIIVAFVDGALVEYCEAYENGALNDAPGGGPIGIWAWEANNVNLQFNESHHNRSGGGDGGGFDLDGGVTNSVMQYNYSHDNVGAGYGMFQFDYAHAYDHNVVRYNVSQRDGLQFGGGIHFWAAVTAQTGIQNTLVHNNVFYIGANQAGAGIDEIDVGTVTLFNTTVLNNVFISEGPKAVVDIAQPGGGWTFNGNVYQSLSGAAQFLWGNTPYSGLKAWRKATGQEKFGGANTGFEGNPGLVAAGQGGTIDDAHALATLSAYQLHVGAAAQDIGLPLASFSADPGPQDFYGDAAQSGAAPDAGVHETDCSAPPLSNDDRYTISKKTVVTKAATGVLANDIGCTRPTLAVVVLPTKGTLLLNADGSFTYTANSRASADSFTYEASNANGVSQAVVSLSPN